MPANPAAIAGFTAPSGQLELRVVTSSNGGLAVYYGNPLSGGQWNWATYENPTTTIPLSEPTIAIGPNDELNIVAVGSNGTLNYFVSPYSGNWSSFQIAGPPISSIAGMAVLPTALYIVAVAIGGGLYIYSGPSASQLSASLVPGSSAALYAGMVISPPNPIRFPVGEQVVQVNVAATDNDGNLTYYWRWYDILRPPGNFTWNPSPVPNSGVAKWVPSIAVRSTGEVDIVGGVNKLLTPCYYYWTNGAGSPWNNQTKSLYGSWTGPAIAIDRNDTAHVICTNGGEVAIEGVNYYGLNDSQLALGSSTWSNDTFAVDFLSVPPDETPSGTPGITTSPNGEIDLVYANGAALTHFALPPGSNTWIGPDLITGG